MKNITKTLIIGFSEEEVISALREKFPAFNDLLSVNIIDDIEFAPDSEQDILLAIRLYNKN